jgi:hypothetical protein
MNSRIFSLLLGFLLSVAVARANVGALSGVSISGHYILIEHVKNIDALDGIEFHPDGTCKVDYDGNAGVAATYKFGDDGKMTITLGDGSKAFTYGVKWQKISLKLSNDAADFYYALQPDGPSRLTFKDVTGIYDTHNSQGDYATEITADHHYRVHIRDFDPQGRTYFDVYTDGTCSFANGIVTYLPARSLGSQMDVFIKDILAKRDAKGAWVIDPVDDKLLLETPAKDLSFPPPPAGYQATDPP